MTMQQTFTRGEILDPDGKVVAVGIVAIRRTTSAARIVGWSGVLSLPAGEVATITPGDGYVLRLTGPKEWPILVSNATVSFTRGDGMRSSLRFVGIGEPPI